MIMEIIMAKFMVAPLVGAWIEISTIFALSGLPPSLLSWERGLKFPFPDGLIWVASRSSRGSVD